MMRTQRLRHRLFEWYRVQKAARPDEDFYELEDLTPAMLGTFTKKGLATKAAETGTLLEFCRDLVAEFKNRLGARGPPLVAVGGSLALMRNIMRTEPTRMSDKACMQLADAAKRAMTLRAAAGVPLKPKWHLMLHLFRHARKKGNPASYSTFVDEGLNGKLAKMARGCHALTWHRSLLSTFRWVSKRGVRKRINKRVAG